MMKICLDLRYKTESGASSYIKNLVPALLELDKKNRYIFVKYPDQHFEFEARADKIILSPSNNDIVQLVWDVTVLPIKLQSNAVDIYHPLKNPGPFWGKTKKIFTVHSINIDYKGSFPISFRRHLYHTVYTNYFTKKCSRVIAVSNFLSDFIIEGLNIDKKYIDVSYHGVDPKFKLLPKNKIASVIEKYHLPDNFILSVGNITPVKNHLSTVKAFASIADKIEEKYVIIGSKKDPYFEQISEFIENTNLKDRIVFPGFVPSDDLPAVMNEAKLLLFPSLTEGCPVTMLEAFACGLPVIASKRGGLWDLGNECAEFVEDPMDHKGFAKKLEEILTSKETLESLSQKSLATAQKFTWENTARAHLNTYQLSHTQ